MKDTAKDQAAKNGDHLVQIPIMVGKSWFSKLVIDRPKVMQLHRRDAQITVDEFQNLYLVNFDEKKHKPPHPTT